VTSNGTLGKTLKTYIQVNQKNLKEIDKFLNAFNQPKLIPEDINYLNISITSNEIEAITVFLQKESRT
jgi:hypothetical protein